MYLEERGKFNSGVQYYGSVWYTVKKVIANLYTWVDEADYKLLR
jgi:hypothetical protein